MRNLTDFNKLPYYLETTIRLQNHREANFILL